MTEQEKQVLLKDLCARLPYGVKYCREYRDYERDQEMCAVGTLESIGKDGYINDTKVYKVWDIKPYLRPMSSVTEEEERELSKKYVWDINCGQIEIRYHSEGSWDDNIECPTSEYLNLFEWLNSHHFDYRGLIEKGLALEAPEGMYD